MGANDAFSPTLALCLLVTTSYLSKNTTLKLLGPNPRLRAFKLCTGTDTGKKRLSSAQLLELRPVLCFGTLPVQLAGHVELRCTGAKYYCAEIANSNQ
jgi:hypothetical protein